MDVNILLKKVAKEFDLKFDSKNKFGYLVLTNREIIIRNFIGDCPDPIYVKHGNHDKNKIGINLVKYLKTEDYKKDISKSSGGCVISQEELKRELKLISKIPNEKLKKEVKNFYNKIKKKIGNTKRLTLIWKPSKKEEKSELRKEIVLHEFIHELMEDNKIRIRDWRWNEGLITYITNFAIGKLYRFKEKPKLKQSPMWKIYARYTRKWIKLLENIKDPKERKKIILKKVKELAKIRKEYLKKKLKNN